MPPPIFRVSRDYTLANLDFLLAKSLVSVAFSSAMIQGDYLAYLWNYASKKDPYGSEIVTSCIWLAALCAFTSLVDFPFDLYRNFILEKSLEMPVLSVKDFLKESVSSFIVIEIFSTAIAAAVVVTALFAGRLFFIFLWIMSCILLSIGTNLSQWIGYQSTVSLVEFPQGELRNHIEILCKELDFPLEKIEILPYSRVMEEHSCVYYYGVFKKSIVISVNILPVAELQDSLDEEEILALVIHQLGHWYKNHDVKKFCILQTALLMWFLIFVYCFEKKVVYEAFGFHESTPVLVGIMITVQYVMLPYNILTAFTLMSWTRSCEYEADTFAVQLGMKYEIERALIKIYVVSFEFPVVDPLYSKHNFYQPSLLERLHNLNKVSANL
ncbi:CAAX prenyl protease 1 homolog isoform X2 [Coccinella septempunctata]|nr:CAAX prenyl protease 1 homolog isoform X2 [Coccinella septempunctata]